MKSWVFEQWWKYYCNSQSNLCIVMFQNNAAKKSDTFHICNETLQESDFAKNPDSSSLSTFVYSYFHQTGSTLHSSFFSEFTCSLKNLSQQSCVWSRSVRRPKTLVFCARMPIWQIFPSAREQNQSALRYCSKLYENSEVLKIWQWDTTFFGLESRAMRVTCFTCSILAAGLRGNGERDEMENGDR